jgi:hypothetical protein
MANAREGKGYKLVARMVLGGMIVGGIIHTYSGLRYGQLDVLAVGLVGIVIPAGYLMYKGYRDSAPSPAN